jgi:hypothetical protein
MIARPCAQSLPLTGERPKWLPKVALPPDGPSDKAWLGEMSRKRDKLNSRAQSWPWPKAPLVADQGWPVGDFPYEPHHRAEDLRWTHNIVQEIILWLVLASMVL